MGIELGEKIGLKNRINDEKRLKSEWNKIFKGTVCKIFLYAFLLTVRSEGCYHF